MIKIRWLVIYAVTTFIIAVTIVTFFKEIGRIERIANAIEAKMDELVELTRKNQKLQDQIVYYSSPDGVAYLATDKYNLVRPGEKMYRIEIISEDQ